MKAIWPILAISFFFVLAVPKVHAQEPWTGLLDTPANGCINGFTPSGTWAGCALAPWTTVGVTYDGGIPARPTICATIMASTYGNGSMDASSGIAAALNACPANEAVLLSAGTFLIQSADISIPSMVTLRGAGADQTILNCEETGPTCWNMGNISAFVQYDANTAITSGATAGSTSITVASVTSPAIAVGYLGVVEDLNDSWVSIVGGPGGASGGDCSGECGLYSSAMGATVPTRARGQVVKVTAISGTTLTIAPGLYTDYSLSPQFHPYAPTVEAGIENLQVFANNTTSDGALPRAIGAMLLCDHCWASGIEHNYADGNFLTMQGSFHPEVRDCYMTGGYLHASGSTDGAIVFDAYTSLGLVENCIIERSHVGVMFRNGANSNIVGDDYLLSQFDTGSTSFAVDGLDAHSAFTQFNLTEGSIFGGYIADSTWGGHSHGGTFRNWEVGTTLACNSTASGRNTVNCSPIGWNDGATFNGWYLFQADRAFAVDFNSPYFWSIGNILGSSQAQSIVSYGATDFLAQTNSLTWFSGVNRSYDAVMYLYSAGFSGAADPGNFSFDNAFPGTSLMIHGDYSNITGGISWEPGLTHTLPASMYQLSEPAFWPQSGLAYPCIGSDISGGTGPGSHLCNAAPNPAAACFKNTMMGTDGSTGAPYTFNAHNCYYSGTGAPIVSFSPVSLNFGNVPVGVTSSPMTLNLANTGTANLTWTGMITLASYANFNFVSNACPYPGSLNPSSNCNMQITFTPAAIGPLSTTLILNDNSSGAPHMVTLSGTGVGSTPAAAQIQGGKISGGKIAQ